jgi:hypothetical protein
VDRDPWWGKGITQGGMGTWRTKSFDILRSLRSLLKEYYIWFGFLHGMGSMTELWEAETTEENIQNTIYNVQYRTKFICYTLL